MPELVTTRKPPTRGEESSCFLIGVVEESTIEGSAAAESSQKPPRSETPRLLRGNARVLRYRLAVLLFQVTELLLVISLFKFRIMDHYLI